MRLRVLAVALLLAGCTHTRVVQRDGCWVKEYKNRWGDTREEVIACRPLQQEWSEEPLVRAIEDCLYQAQLTRYHAVAQTGGDPGKESTKQVSRCLDQAERLSLERIDRLKQEIASGEAAVKRLHHENDELRKTIVACVEKSPNAIAEARATTENTSDVASSSEKSDTVTPATYTEPRRRLRRTTEVKATPATQVKATSPVCPPTQ